jgi:hypothetical protein
MSEENIQKVVNFYIKHHNSIDPISIESAIRYGIKVGQHKTNQDYVDMANQLLRTEFNTLYEVNEYLNKHLI